MNLFQFIETTDMGEFLVSAVHENGKVTFVSIYPIVDSIVHPPLYMEDEAMIPLVEMIEGKLSSMEWEASRLPAGEAVCLGLSRKKCSQAKKNF